ncbi:threonine ammonia-lyase [Rarobacter faecitabidus]|uniref:L-threonine dehydratase catabolic TdcB n=1 Tax=Rarobacter faecitabidus TaxID=13243 RepID=A0A542ZTZ9_RARFA|nr:threonine ammonia-lyase [Rarobacter faecitabidus]TQL63838.1 threonine dehydratase [Rarobacter faecitabidus]
MSATPAPSGATDPIASAARVLRGVAGRTPLAYSRALSELVGVPVWLKCENLQRTGSFKIRGAYTRMAGLSADERSRGVLAASAGNHAQGVALAAAELGISATIYMPTDAALPKIAATSAYGAEVRLTGDSVADALAAAAIEADETGKVFIHPFDHPDVVAGQGTVALEILEQLPGVATIVSPVGGGGLLAGIVQAVTTRGLTTRVVGVQAAQFASWPPSVASAAPVTVEGRSTMADGIAVARPGDVPFAVAHGRADIVTVEEEDISRALLHLLERSKFVVEPAGAVGVAALLARPEQFARGPVCVVLSGGNVDPTVLLRVIRHGLVAAGRYLNLRVRLIDRPGALASLVVELARDGGNVMHVDHVRTGPDLAIDEVEVIFQVETKGPEHCQELLASLRGRGYRIVD